MEAGAGRATSAGGASDEGSILSAACQCLAPLFGGYFYLKKLFGESQPRDAGASGTAAWAT